MNTSALPLSTCLHLLARSHVTCDEQLIEYAASQAMEAVAHHYTADPSTTVREWCLGCLIPAHQGPVAFSSTHASTDVATFAKTVEAVLRTDAPRDRSLLLGAALLMRLRSRMAWSQPGKPRAPGEVPAWLDLADTLRRSLSTFTIGTGQQSMTLVEAEVLNAVLELVAVAATRLKISSPGGQVMEENDTSAWDALPMIESCLGLAIKFHIIGAAATGTTSYLLEAGRDAAVQEINSLRRSKERSEFTAYLNGNERQGSRLTPILSHALADRLSAWLPPITIATKSGVRLNALLRWPSRPCDANMALRSALDGIGPAADEVDHAHGQLCITLVAISLEIGRRGDDGAAAFWRRDAASTRQFIEQLRRCFAVRGRTVSSLAAALLRSATFGSKPSPYGVVVEPLLDVLSDASRDDAVSHCAAALLADAATAMPHAVLSRLFVLLVSPNAHVRSNAQIVFRECMIRFKASRSPQGRLPADVNARLVIELMKQLGDDDLDCRIGASRIFSEHLMDESVLPLVVAACTRDADGRRRGAAIRTLALMLADEHPEKALARMCHVVSEKACATVDAEVSMLRDWDPAVTRSLTPGDVGPLPVSATVAAVTDPPTMTPADVVKAAFRQLCEGHPETAGAANRSLWARMVAALFAVVVEAGSVLNDSGRAFGVQLIRSLTSSKFLCVDDDCVFSILSPALDRAQHSASVGATAEVIPWLPLRVAPRQWLQRTESRLATAVEYMLTSSAEGPSRSVRRLCVEIASRFSGDAVRSLAGRISANGNCEQRRAALFLLCTALSNASRDATVLDENCHDIAALVDAVSMARSWLVPSCSAPEMLERAIIDTAATTTVVIFDSHSLSASKCSSIVDVWSEPPGAFCGLLCTVLSSAVTLFPHVAKTGEGWNRFVAWCVPRAVQAANAFLVSNEHHTDGWVRNASYCVRLIFNIVHVGGTSQTAVGFDGTTAVGLFQFAIRCARYPSSNAVRDEGVKLLAALLTHRTADLAGLTPTEGATLQRTLREASEIHTDPAIRHLASILDNTFSAP